MKLKRICQKIHFDNISKPGTIIECIDDKGDCLNPLIRLGKTYEVTRGTWETFIQLKGFRYGTYLIERFKRVQI